MTNIPEVIKVIEAGVASGKYVSKAFESVGSIGKIMLVGSVASDYPDKFTLERQLFRSNGSINEDFLKRAGYHYEPNNGEVSAKLIDLKLLEEARATLETTNSGSRSIGITERQGTSQSSEAGRSTAEKLEALASIAPVRNAQPLSAGETLAADDNIGSPAPVSNAQIAAAEQTGETD